MATTQTTPNAPFFVQADTRIRQSNTNAGFLAFGDVVTLGQKDFPSGRDHDRPEPTNAPPVIPAGTGWYLHAEVATANHFNLFLIACQLPDGTVCGMALRPKAFAKLEQVSADTVPDTDIETDEGEDHERGAHFQVGDQVYETKYPDCIGTVDKLDLVDPEFYWVSFERAQVSNNRYHYSTLTSVMI